LASLLLVGLAPLASAQAAGEEKHAFYLGAEVCASCHQGKGIWSCAADP